MLLLQDVLSPDELEALLAADELENTQSALEELHYHTVGQHLRRERRTKGWSLEEAAKWLKLNRETVESWERDQDEPKLAELVNASQVYGCSVDQLLFGPSVGDTHSNLSQQLGHRLKLARTGRSLSRKKAAEAAGLSYTLFASIENGHHSPTVAELRAIGQALGLSIHELLTGEPYGEGIQRMELDWILGSRNMVYFRGLPLTEPVKQRLLDLLNGIVIGLNAEALTITCLNEP